MIDFFNKRISNRVVIAAGLVCWFAIYLALR